MNAKPPRTARAAALVVLLASCASTYREWQDLGERTLPFEDLWQAVVDTSTRHGMPIHPRLSDRGRGAFTSRWREDTPGFGQSRRLRLRAELIERAGDGGKARWQVRLCVERQKVADMARGLEPREQDWEADGQEPELEQVIAAQLRLRFGDPMPRSMP